MKQRLGIAAAVLGNPDIVVLDEPTNALDDDGKEMVKSVVRKQKERGALVIISCHDMQTLEELSDEIVNLRRAGYAGEKRVLIICGLILLILYTARVIVVNKMLIECRYTYMMWEKL